MTMANDLAVRRALETAGVEFIDENGGGPGVRLRTRQGKKSPAVCWAMARNKGKATSKKTRPWDLKIGD
jgi:hypothetical protein